MIVEPINSENDIHFGEFQYVLILPTEQIASLYRHIFNLLHSLEIEHSVRAQTLKQEGDYTRLLVLLDVVDPTLVPSASYLINSTIQC